MRRRYADRLAKLRTDGDAAREEHRGAEEGTGRAEVIALAAERPRARNLLLSSLHSLLRTRCSGPPLIPPPVDEAPPSYARAGAAGHRGPAARRAISRFATPIRQRRICSSCRKRQLVGHPAKIDFRRRAGAVPGHRQGSRQRRVVHRAGARARHRAARRACTFRARSRSSMLADAMLLLEFRHIDQQLKIAREERLLEQQQANRDLIRSLAHEIKNPLGGIRGAAQLLERELDRPPLIEYTQVIIGEADRLADAGRPAADAASPAEVPPHEHPRDSGARRHGRAGGVSADRDPLRFRHQPARVRRRSRAAYAGDIQRRAQRGAGARGRARHAADPARRRASHAA